MTIEEYAEKMQDEQYSREKINIASLKKSIDEKKEAKDNETIILKDK